MSINRRRFLHTAAAVTAGPLILPARGRGQAPASERITLGFIGVGKMGLGHLGSFAGMDDVQVLAVCDVVQERRNAAKKIVEDRYAKAKAPYKGCDTYTDFRQLLDRKDIDAVVIATPDHWHALPAVHAARAGKHIYCEKPLTHVIADGRRIVDEVKKHGVIFQTGSQQRSEFGGRFRLAVELVRNGRIGMVKQVGIGVGGPAIACDLKEEPVPAGTDWDLWLGPAPLRGYSEVLCPKGVHNHFPAWRRYKEYAGGGLADMGAHHFDIAQWALDMDGSGPVKIEPPAKGDSGLRFTYANGVTMVHGAPADCVFEGDKGTILVSRGMIQTKPEDILKQPIGENEFHVYPSSNHRRNWIECIRSKKDTICPAEVGHRSCTVCLLGNIGYWLRRPLQWDPKADKFVGDDEANRLVSREMRAPWKF
jgi:predicted dehydrogenase